MYTEFDQILETRRAIVVDFLRDNIKALEDWNIPAEHRLGFELLAGKLRAILVESFGERPNGSRFNPEKQKAIKRKATSKKSRAAQNRYKRV